MILNSVLIPILNTYLFDVILITLIAQFCTPHILLTVTRNADLRTLGPSQRNLVQLLSQSKSTYKTGEFKDHLTHLGSQIAVKALVSLQCLCFSFIEKMSGKSLLTKHKQMNLFLLILN